MIILGAVTFTGTIIECEQLTMCENLKGPLIFGLKLVCLLYVACKT